MSKGKQQKDRRTFNKRDPRYRQKREQAERVTAQEAVPWWERDLRQKLKQDGSTKERGQDQSSEGMKGRD